MIDDYDVPDPPCDHRDNFIGTIMAGSYDKAHCSVSTCGACAWKSARYVEMITNQPANPLLTYAEVRGQLAIWEVTPGPYTGVKLVTE